MILTIRKFKFFNQDADYQFNYFESHLLLNFEFNRQYLATSIKRIVVEAIIAEQFAFATNKPNIFMNSLQPLKLKYF